MIDSTSINYALGKISEGWQKAAPALQNVGEKYVRYQVATAIVDAGACLLGLGVCLLLFRKIFKAGKAANNLDEPQYTLPLVVISIGILALSLASIINVRCAVLAVIAPEMYTVQSVIDAARAK